MPEGPEVRLEADKIGQAIAGELAEDVWFAFPALRRFVRRLRGRMVRAVESRGKAMLVRFDNGLNVYSHNQLYGRWFVKPRGQLPRTNRDLRFAVHTSRNSALLYSASEIDVLRDDALGQHSFLEKLGPDVLAREVGYEDIESRLADPRFGRRSLGALLLDQGFVCGLGNYLRSEILFAARLAPELRPKDLAEDQRRDLAAAIRDITWRAYRTRGVTNDPDDVRRLRAEGVARRDYRHFVFSRAGGACPACGEGIVKSTVAGRRLYRCPACQG
ncbi:MAG: endonuclease VIII [bacterium]|nr:endonuclease VIII [bacterium]